MREIKFRVWHKKCRIMDYTGKLNWGKINNECSVELVNKALEVNEYRVFMQYIGLVDKNGREIYEGDILDFEKDKRGISRFLVFYETSAFKLKGIKNGIICHHYVCDYKNNDSEVIGNIYENPELSVEN